MIAIMNLLLGILEIIIKEVGTITIDAISSLVPSKRKEKYNARFIDAGKLLFKSNKGFCLTGERSLSIEDSFSNALILGGSGSGKSSSILIPSILKMAGHSSLCIHDPSSELFLATSSALKKMGYEIKVLCFNKPEISQAYNPLHRVRSASDISKVCKLVVYSALGKGNDPFWNTSSEGLISFFCKYLVTYADPKFCNLYNVLSLINGFSSDPESTDRLIVKTGNSELISEYKAWVAYGDKTLMSIIATARAALSIFSDPSVAMVTASDTLAFKEFRRAKTALYITNSVKDMRYYSCISNIFFSQFIGEILEQIPEKTALPCFFLLDESSSLYLDLLPTAISNIRKYRSGILQIYQHYNQMIDLYGSAQARNIAANSGSKVYMENQPIEIATELSSILGKVQFTDADGKEVIRPLLTPDEIRISKEAIILISNNLPILTKLVPWYRQAELKKLVNLSPVELSPNFDQSPPPLIHLE